MPLFSNEIKTAIINAWEQSDPLTFSQVISKHYKDNKEATFSALIDGVDRPLVAGSLFGKFGFMLPQTGLVKDFRKKLRNLLLILIEDEDFTSRFFITFMKSHQGLMHKPIIAQKENTIVFTEVYKSIIKRYFRYLNVFHEIKGIKWLFKNVTDGLYINYKYMSPGDTIVFQALTQYLLRVDTQVVSKNMETELERVRNIICDDARKLMGLELIAESYEELYNIMGSVSPNFDWLSNHSKFDLVAILLITRQTNLLFALAQKSEFIKAKAIQCLAMINIDIPAEVKQLCLDEFNIDANHLSYVHDLLPLDEKSPLILLFKPYDKKPMLSNQSSNAVLSESPDKQINQLQSQLAVLTAEVQALKLENQHLRSELANRPQPPQYMYRPYNPQMFQVPQPRGFIQQNGYDANQHEQQQSTISNNEECQLTL